MLSSKAHSPANRFHKFMRITDALKKNAHHQNEHTIIKVWTGDLLNIFKFTKGIFDVYFQGKDIAYFHNLRSILEPST